MKSLLVILTIAALVSILGWHYIDRSIDLLVAESQCSNSESTTSPTASTSLTVEDTGYNDTADTVQTVYGVNLYQEAGVNIQ